MDTDEAAKLLHEGLVDEDELAEYLYEKLRSGGWDIELVDRHELLNKLEIPDAKSERVLAKVRLYHEALILLCLQARTMSDSRYGGLIVSFERLVYPNTEQEGVVKVEAIRGAMRNLADLPKGAETTVASLSRWSQDWLRVIGLEETNPGKLTLFATWWIPGQFALVCRCLDEMGALLK